MEKYLKFCHTERSEVSINLKCKVALKSVDISPFTKAQYDKSAVFVGEFLLRLRYDNKLASRLVALCYRTLPYIHSKT